MALRSRSVAKIPVHGAMQTRLSPSSPLLPLLPLLTDSLAHSLARAFQRLSQEIEQFYEWMRPKKAELKARQDLIDKIFGICDAEFDAAAEPIVFGSYSTGLYLPTSDIDIVVMTGERAGSPSLNSLFRLSNAIERSKAFSVPPKMQLITGARVSLSPHLDPDLDLDFQHH